ncbi:MAG: glycosyltransferase [Anaerolineales bacterium]|nr:glycosyltransferase [Anaerolineales bacterium]
MTAPGNQPPTASAPRISVIVPAHNMAGSVTNCVQALRRQTLPPAGYEIIVVDDGSTDGTGRAAAAAGATQVIHKPRGGYAAAARNLGIRTARGDILCFTDADCCPHPDWLAQITAPLANPDLAGVKGTYDSQQRELVARFVQLEYEEKYDRLRRQPRINFIDFYSAAFRRQVLLANGGFDETFPNSEDRELSFRLATRGYQMVFQPHATVTHIHAHTLPDYFSKKVRNGYWTAQVVRRFPTHGVDDSHTPQSAKLQILLMALCYASLVALLLSPWGGLLPLLWLLIFALTTLPFVRAAWAKDRPVALAAPFLLAARATALGLGYAWGLARPVHFQPAPNDSQVATISGLNYLLKRGLDLAISLPGLLLTGLLWPWLTLHIKRHAPHSPRLQRQRFAGQNGTPFTRYCFTPTPRLRRWRLAGLPQLYNVLKGDMSLVGPRPESIHTAATYPDWHRPRLAVKPGILPPTRPGPQTDDERVQQELAYITHYRLSHDLRRLWAARRRPA